MTLPWDRVPAGPVPVRTAPAAGRQPGGVHALLARNGRPATTPEHAP
ncbi:hypothetical protein ACFUJY_26335 [Streptomyces sp. NPDC057249]